MQENMKSFVDENELREFDKSTKEQKWQNE
jgi:hypothetical protein